MLWHGLQEPEVAEELAPKHGLCLHPGEQPQ